MDMQRRVTIVIAACLAGLLGSYLYAGILNPLKVEWLLQEGDLLQHFLGWHYYRHEPWDWPIGALHTYGTEVRSSIVFTDSLPLLAIPLKLIQAWLPDPFQYQGLASVAHLMLNAIAACLIFTRLKMSPIAAIALSLVVAIMPAVLFRGPGGAGHESLMAHWTFLFAIYLVLFRTDPGWKARCQWSLMLTLAVLVHFYLFLLVGLLWSLWWLLRTSQQYRLKGLAYHRQWWLLWGAYSLLQPLIILFVMWGVGYLHSGGESPGADGFGFYSAELVAYFNAYSFLAGIISASVALPVWVPGIGGQYEGMSYVGAGIMALWLMALLLFIRRPIHIPTTYRWPVKGLGALAIGLFIFALSDKVVIGPYTVNLPLPWPESLKAILRASGRMVWVLMYLSIFLAGAILVQRLTPRNATLAALCVLVIQLFDLQHWHHYFHTRSQQAATYHMAEDPRFTGWDSSGLQAALSQRQSLHITQADDIVGMLPLAWLAGQHGMAVNVAYVARITPTIIHQAVAPAQQALMAGQPDPSVVYAITNPETVQACNLVNMQCIVTPMATFAWQLTSEETQ
ncbi:MAG: DUF6311 domain-containing protein [Halomonadaceae bacterium]|uniref:Glycosyltransferase RgtA/B/C/D-like domain-containing protein n=1 Tax=Halomonas colorata TaxID=2742615 RepID=A0ABR9G0E2_9GAMM|nr:DUF6311 domain-containing protein [Halomonas colorata]MBE0464345.1 hypothetical protein [Halomonas colorata]